MRHARSTLAAILGSAATVAAQAPAAGSPSARPGAERTALLGPPSSADSAAVFTLAVDSLLATEASRAFRLRSVPAAPWAAAVVGRLRAREASPDALAPEELTVALPHFVGDTGRVTASWGRCLPNGRYSERLREYEYVRVNATTANVWRPSSREIDGRGDGYCDLRRPR